MPSTMLRFEGPQNGDARPAEPVLIGVLRGEDPIGHLEWIRGTRQYYTPLAKDQPRLFAARTVAFYEPSPAG